MDSILSLLPVIFTYWTGLLLAWSAMAAYGLGRIIYLIEQQGEPVRRSDVACLTLIVMSSLVLGYCLIGQAALVPDIIDVLVGVDIWYTVFLGFVTTHNLAILPAICTDNFCGVLRKVV